MRRIPTTSSPCRPSWQERASALDARLPARRCVGAGHATTLLLFGLPILMVRAYVPAVVESAAEVLIGAIVVALAVRLWMRWRRGALTTSTADGRQRPPALALR